MTHQCTILTQFHHHCEHYKYIQIDIDTGTLYAYTILYMIHLVKYHVYVVGNQGKPTDTYNIIIRMMYLYLIYIYTSTINNNKKKEKVKTRRTRLRRWQRRKKSNGSEKKMKPVYQPF